MSQLAIDAEALYAELLGSVRVLFKPGMRLVGVTSGGVWLAERLQRDLGLAEPIGVISSAMHRDDYSRRGMTSAAQTQIPFDVDNASILLLDDVLYTGRTIRAVLNELFDVCAARVALAANQSLSLARGAEGQFSFNVKAL